MAVAAASCELVTALGCECELVTTRGLSRALSPPPSQGPADSATQASAFHVYTYGACYYPGTRARVTNQMMELQAAHAGLVAAVRSLRHARPRGAPLPRSSAEGGRQHQLHHQPKQQPGQQPDQPRVLVYTDSAYVMNCMTKWVSMWERTGWVTKTKRPVQNVDTLRAMHALTRECAPSTPAFVRLKSPTLYVTIPLRAPQAPPAEAAAAAPAASPEGRPAEKRLSQDHLGRMHEAAGLAAEAAHKSARTACVFHPRGLHQPLPLTP